MEKGGKAQALIFAIIFILIIAAVFGIVFLFSQSSDEDSEETEGESGTLTPIQPIQPIPEPETPSEPEIQQPISEPDPQIKEIDVIAKRWEFSPNPIRVRKGDTVILNIKSIDVAHGFAIPDFGISERLSPGETTRIEFIADKRGVFRFFCNVQCGSGHGSMFGQLIVE